MDEKPEGTKDSCYYNLYDRTPCTASGIYLYSLWEDGTIQFL